MLVYTVNKNGNKTLVYNVNHGIKGDKGDTGATGPQGIQGIPGDAATIQIGTVTSGAAPSVVNSGNEHNAIFDFTLVKGDTGETGAQGDAAGFGTPRASITTIAAGAEPTVSVITEGPNTAKVFDFRFGMPDNMVLVVDNLNSSSASSALSANQGRVLDSKIPTVAASIADGESGYTTGDQVYDYVAEHSGDKWEFIITPRHSYEATGYTALLISGVRKNGEAYNEQTIYYTMDVQSDTGYNSGIQGNITTSAGGAFIYTTSYRPARLFYLRLYEDSARKKCIYSGTITDAWKASSIADGEVGFTTGDQVYDYVANNKADVWSVDYNSYNDSKYHFFNIYKNGEKITEGTFYASVQQLSVSGGQGNRIGSGQATYDSGYWKIIADNSPSSYCRSLRLDLYSNSNLTEHLTSSIIPVVATSIADFVEGFTTGDQVYDYVSTQVGNINSILQTL